jgi:hypothetical protein
MSIQNLFDRLDDLDDQEFIIEGLITLRDAGVNLEIYAEDLDAFIQQADGSLTEIDRDSSLYILEDMIMDACEEESLERDISTREVLASYVQRLK